MALQKSSSKPKILRGFELSIVIGKGSYGEVWLARHIKDKRPYVLKKINLKSTSDKERRAAEQEARLLSNLKHPNIVTYKDSFQTGERYLYIAMQYCEGGDLYTWLKERKGKVLEEKQVVEWFIQIAMALQYLHERDILHRDLKTQNIFLTKNKIIKVGDLGIARVLENSSDMATTLIGTPYYMSPELFSSKPYNQKLPPMPQLYSSELVQLIQNMLHQDPSRRPSVSRLLRMSYVKKNIALFLEETRKSRRPLPPTPDKTAKAVSSLPSSSSYSAHPHSHKQYCNPSVAKKDQLDGRANHSSAKVVHPDVESIEIDSQNTMINDTLPVQVIHNKEIAAKIENEAENECSSSSHTNSISEEHSLSPNSSIISLSSSTQSSLNECASAMEESDSGTQDTVIKNTVIQQDEEKVKDAAGSKGKFMPLNIQNGTESIMKKHPAEKSRPLPPPPVIDISNSEPQNTNSCVPRLSSSSSSSKECSSNLGEGEAPKSLPNVLARQKRRQKQSLSCSLERHECRVELKQPSKLDESYDIHGEPRSVVPLKNVLPQQQYRQPEDDEDEENSSPEDNTRTTKNKWDKLREDRDIENLAVVLNTTLQTYSWKSNDEKSDDDCTTIIKSTNTVMDTNSDDGEINDLPSAETLVQTKRLSDRINILEKNCESGVGKQILQQAIDILDKFEEEDIKPRLEELLGEEKFDQYAGKIWQLKYCRQMAVS
ncbi:serine/threonine-protein kinase Nek4 isoform X3 [Octopus bimaculoides]|uniref:serine/threonine-protein kinase Nek4 isoform X3 n=1 Tax=Octopus bimaculoides TaxID=37653 RepID=UPI0022E1B729|nr:serine/threonine-protein kinase Nek4 isoform X3 [Octopus bimaculoides]